MTDINDYIQAEAVFLFPPEVQFDKKGSPQDVSNAIVERVSVTCPTELSTWAEKRRQELGAEIVNFSFTTINSPR